MYEILFNFFIISARVALVPIPEPFICSLSLSSSINFPAFSIARIIEPDVYLLGGVVSPSFIVISSKFNFCPFFNLLSASLTVVSTLSFLSALTTSKYPSFVHTFEFE